MTNTETADTFWLDVIGEIQIALTLVCVIIFLITPRQGRKEYLFFGLVLIVTGISSVIGETMWWVFRKSGNLAISIHLPFIVAFYVLLYKTKIHWKHKNLVAYLIIAVFFIYASINFFFIQGPLGYNSYSTSFQAAIMIIISVTYFFILIQQLPTQSITKLPMFWINSAVLIYYSGTFFVYLSADYLIHVENDRLIFSWSVHHILGCVYYMILAYAAWLIRAQHRFS